MDTEEPGAYHQRAGPAASGAHSAAASPQGPSAAQAHHVHGTPSTLSLHLHLQFQAQPLRKGLN
jgi:hypothetical protein